MSVVKDRTLLPAEVDDHSSLREVGEALALPGAAILTVGEHDVALPDAVRSLLVDAVAALSRGEAVTVAPRRTVLTTQEAADLLSITRPTLVRLLEDGKIPFTTPGRHRRIQLADVLEFQQNQRAARLTALERMAADAEPDPDYAVDDPIVTR